MRVRLLAPLLDRRPAPSRAPIRPVLAEWYTREKDRAMLSVIHRRGRASDAGAGAARLERKRFRPTAFVDGGFRRSHMPSFVFKRLNL